MSRKIPASWCAHRFRMRPDSLSGPSTFLMIDSFHGRAHLGQLQDKRVMLFFQSGKMNSLSSARCITASIEFVQVVWESGILTNQLITALIVCYCLDASWHTMWDGILLQGHYGKLNLRYYYPSLESLWNNGIWGKLPLT